MKKLWVHLGPPTLAAAAATGITVFVLHGSATAKTPQGDVVAVAAGERWTSGDARPTRQEAAPALGSRAQALGGARAEPEPPPIVSARVLVPVKLNIPGVGLLQFRLAAEPLVRDARFRLIYFLPADPPTMRQCAAWASSQEPGVRSQ